MPHSFPSSLLATSFLLLSAAPAAFAREDARAAPGIQGHRTFIHHTAQGTREVPVDLSAVPVDAWVRGADGQFTLYPGQGHANGTFSVPGVPEGVTYTLRLGDELPWFVSTERDLDLSEPRLGRVDQRMPTASTPLVLDVDGLQPWVSGDWLQLVSANAGMVIIDAQDWLFPNSPLDGDTRLSAAEYELAGNSENRLIDAARGDELLVTRLSRPGDVPYRALTQVFTPAPFTTVEGQPTFVSGAFTDVPQTESLTYAYREAPFAAHLRDIHPRAEPTPGRTASLLVSAMPAGYAHGFFSSIPDLLDAELHEGSPAEPLRYGNPFPARWRPVANVIYPASVTYALGNTRPTRQSGGLSSTDLLQKVVAHPLAPRLTPVRELRIDGAPASEDQALGSLTPTVSWTAPAVGAPSGYEVVVQPLFVVGTRTLAGFGARLRTSSTQVTLPPGTLESGQAYFLRVRAIQQGSVDLGRHPLHTDFPVANAYAFTGVLVAP